MYFKRIDNIYRAICIEGRHQNFYLQNYRVRLNIPNTKGRSNPVLSSTVASVDREYEHVIYLPLEDTAGELPAFFKLGLAKGFKSYQEYFDQSAEFSSPHCEQLLYAPLDLDRTEYYTNMANARGRYPPQEYADDIRQKQASKLAFR